MKINTCVINDRKYVDMIDFAAHLRKVSKSCKKASVAAKMLGIMAEELIEHSKITGEDT